MDGRERLAGSRDQQQVATAAPQRRWPAQRQRSRPDRGRHWDGISTPPGPSYDDRFTATAAPPAVATRPTRTARTARSTSSSPPSCCSTTPSATTTSRCRERRRHLRRPRRRLRRPGRHRRRPSSASSTQPDHHVDRRRRRHPRSNGGRFSAPDANETHALVAGLTCGRPSNPATGEDECHAEASYAIVDKGIKENRNHATDPATTACRLPEPPTAEQLLPHRQHRWRGSWLRRQRQPRLQDRPRRRYVRSGSRRRLLRADRRLHELPRSDRRGQHRRGQLHVPARPDPGRHHERHLLPASRLRPARWLRSRIWSGWSGSLGATKTVTDLAPARRPTTASA